MWPFLTAAGTILIVAGVLVAWHVRTWRVAKGARLSAGELKFAFEQYRRRMQTSAMLGFVGGLIVGGPWVVAPLAVLLYWLGVVVLIVWIMLLAGADMLATRMHYAQAETEAHLRQVKLQAELDAARRPRKNERRGGRGLPH